jgi:hypothetical protein
MTLSALQETIRASFKTMPPLIVDEPGIGHQAKDGAHQIVFWTTTHHLGESHGRCKIGESKF